MPRNNIPGAGAAMNIRNLPGGRRKIFIALIPFHCRKFGEGRYRQVNGVFCQMRIGNVALHAVNPELARKRAAAAVLDCVPKAIRRTWFTDHAVVENFLAVAQPLDHLDRAVGGDAFFIRGDKQCDRSPVLRMRGNKFLGGDDESGNRSLHVAGASAVQPSIANRGCEGVRSPLGHRPGWNDIGMPCECNQGRHIAAPRPQICNAPGFDGFAAKTDARKSFRDQLLTVGVFRRD